MKEEFFEWLNNCPVRWFLDTEEDGSLTYTFIKEKEEEEE